MIRILLVFLALLASPAVAQQVAVRDVLVNAVEKVIRPGFADLDDKAAALHSAMDALCAAPSATALEAARAAFGPVATAHARVEIYRFGPLTAENRAERLLFWPDRKGIALRQVQEILSSEDGRATELDTLLQKSVGVQGLTAIEFVLFGTGSDDLSTDAGDFRCRYGATVAAAIARVANEMDAAWAAPDGIADHVVNPGPGNTDFRTETESLEGLVGSMAHSIEMIRDTRLQPFLGVAGGKTSPRSALYWRSGQTVPAVDAGFAGIRVLFDESNIMALAKSGHRWIKQSVDFEFANAERAADSVTLPVADALKDERQAKALRYLSILTGSLDTLLGDTLAVALGLSVGFSSLDGD